PWFAHAGLALSIGLGATLNAGVLLFLLYRRKLYQPGTGWLRFFLSILPAQAGLACVLLAANHYIAWTSAHVGYTGELSRAAQLALVLAVSGLVYFALLWVCGIRPRHFKA